MNRLFLALILPILWVAVTCAPGVDERCGDGFYYEHNSCWKDVEPPDTEADTDPPISEPDGGSDASDVDVDADADSDADQELPIGLGDTCYGKPNDCKGQEADYCVKNPSEPEGYCSVTHCSLAPDDCPSGYNCCKFVMIPNDPTFCVQDEEWDAMEAMCKP